MAERLYYAKAGDIDPLALVNEVVAVFITDRWRAYEIKYFQPLQRSRPLVFNQGALVAGGATGDTVLNNLNQATDPPHMAQLRYYPIDDIEVRFKIGQAGARFTTQMITTTADRFTILRDPCLHSTEVLVLMNNTPFIDVTNVTGYAIPMARVAFFGYHFRLEDMNAAEADPKDLKAHAKLQGRSIVFVPSS